MFISYTNGISYMSAGSVIPASYDGLYYSSVPESSSQKLAGVQLVAQYVESYRFKTEGVCQIQTAQLESVHSKAYELDEAASDAGLLDYASDTYPSVNSIMQAFIDLGYVTNASGIGYVRPQQNAIKYFVRQYGGVVLETKITDQTHNAYDYGIDAVGSTLNEDFTKGFIAFGYDASNLYVQNSLGICAGSLGFHKIPWAVATQLAVKGAVFRLDNPS